MNVWTGQMAMIHWRDIARRWSESPAARERIIILGALALVSLLIVIWAVFFRPREGKSKTRRHASRHARERAGAPSAPVAGEDGESGSGKRRKWRRRRREHRPMNPTLAQTGGLPPIRSEDRPPQA
jgi:hypothetical protein